MFYFYGTPRCRLEIKAWHTFLNDRNIRLISIDRPGMGLSTSVPGRKILDWPTDVEALANHLNVGKKFTVVGVSGGGHYALACAYVMPERLQGVGVITSIAPWQDFRKTTEHMYWGGFKNWLIAKYGGEAGATALWKDTLSAIQETAAGNLTEKGEVRNLALAHLRIQWWRESLEKEFIDKKDPILEDYTESMMVAFLQGPAGYANEFKLSTRSWGLDVKDIGLKGVKIFHGQRDVSCPLWNTKYLAERLPGSRLRVYEGEDHYTVTKVCIRLQTVFVEIMNQSLRSSMV